MPPAYTAVPAGEDLTPHAGDYPLGTILMTQKPLDYVSETVPEGARITMVGYKTELAVSANPLRNRIVFRPCGRFPDGTYRCIPLAQSVACLPLHAQA